MAVTQGRTFAAAPSHQGSAHGEMGNAVASASSRATSERVARGWGIAAGRPPGGRFQMTRPGSSASSASYQARRCSPRRACRSKDRRRRVGSASRWDRSVSAVGIEHQYQIRQAESVIGESPAGLGKLMVEPGPWDGSNPAQTPAVVQLQGVAVALSQPDLILKRSSLVPAVGVHRHPICGVDGRVRAMGFEPGWGVLVDKCRQMTPTPSRLPGSAGVFDHDDHPAVATHVLHQARPAGRTSRGTCGTDRIGSAAMIAGASRTGSLTGTDSPRASCACPAHCQSGLLELSRVVWACR